MTRQFSLALALCFLAFPATAQEAGHGQGHAGDMRSAAPQGARVYLISPQDGATVSNPVTFRFGATGIGVAPSGVEWPDTGHHHLLINVDPASVDLTQPLPADDQHRHFGGGQTEVTLDLPAGTHSFMLVMGDYNHVPHDPPIMSVPITVTVE